MDKSPNLGLHLTPETDVQKKFLQYRVELSGDTDDSNMMILDTAIQKLIDQVKQCQTTVYTWGDLKKGSASSTTGEGE